VIFHEPSGPTRGRKDHSINGSEEMAGEKQKREEAEPIGDYRIMKFQIFSQQRGRSGMRNTPVEMEIPWKHFKKGPSSVLRRELPP